jgi:hypothetical protein
VNKKHFLLFTGKKNQSPKLSTTVMTVSLSLRIAISIPRDAQAILVRQRVIKSHASVIQEQQGPNIAAHCGNGPNILLR